MIFEANIVSGYPNKVIRNELTGPVAIKKDKVWSYSALSQQSN